MKNNNVKINRNGAGRRVEGRWGVGVVFISGKWEIIRNDNGNLR